MLTDASLSPSRIPRLASSQAVFVPPDLMGILSWCCVPVAEEEEEAGVELRPWCSLRLQCTLIANSPWHDLFRQFFSNWCSYFRFSSFTVSEPTVRINSERKCETLQASSGIWISIQANHSTDWSECHQVWHHYCTWWNINDRYSDCLFSPLGFAPICCWFHFSFIWLYPAPHQHICSNLPGIL